MIISEKQVLSLIMIVQKYIIGLELMGVSQQIQAHQYSRIIDEIYRQQPEELKGIE